MEIDSSFVVSMICPDRKLLAASMTGPDEAACSVPAQATELRNAQTKTAGTTGCGSPRIIALPSICLCS
jgi:hypothetical protein